MIAPVGIALGSNLGNRAAELDAGISFLRSLSVDDKIREAPRLDTAPVDCPPGSPPFLNTVAEIRIDTETLPPLDLLSKLSGLLNANAADPTRARRMPHALSTSTSSITPASSSNEPGLVIPHPRAHLRRFVLETALASPPRSRSAAARQKRCASFCCSGGLRPSLIPHPSS